MISKHIHTCMTCAGLAKCCTNNVQFINWKTVHRNNLLHIKCCTNRRLYTWPASSEHFIAWITVSLLWRWLILHRWWLLLSDCQKQNERMNTTTTIIYDNMWRRTAQLRHILSIGEKRVWLSRRRIYVHSFIWSHWLSKPRRTRFIATAAIFCPCMLDALIMSCAVHKNHTLCRFSLIVNKALVGEPKLYNDFKYFSWV